MKKTDITSKDSNKSSLVKIGLIYTVSNIVVKGIAFITTPVFSRLMPQTDYGEFSGIASWASIITIIVTLNLHSSINRAKYDYHDEINQFNSTLLIIGSVFTIICWSIIEINIDFFVGLFSMEKQYIRSIMVYSLFSPAIQVMLAKARIYSEYKIVVFITWVSLCISTFFSLLLVLLFDNKLWGRTVGTYLIVGIVYIVFWIYIIYKGKGFHKKYCKYALHLSLPLVPHELAGILLVSSDRIIINKLCGGTDAALYSLSYTISMILSVLLSSLNQAWIPWFYDHLNNQKLSIIKKASSIYLLIFAIGTIGIMLIGPEFVYLFGGKDYKDAKYIIPPICFAVLLQFVYTLYVNVEFYTKKTILISFATVLATIVNIVLNYICIPIWGYTAAAYTTVIGYFLMAILHYIIVKRIKQYSQLFNEKIIVLTVLCSFVIMLLVLFSYSYLAIRLSIILLLLVLLTLFTIKHKGTIKKIIKKK